MKIDSNRTGCPTDKSSGQDGVERVTRFEAVDQSRRSGPISSVPHKNSFAGSCRTASSSATIHTAPRLRDARLASLDSGQLVGPDHRE